LKGKPKTKLFLKSNSERKGGGRNAPKGEAAAKKRMEKKA